MRRESERGELPTTRAEVDKKANLVKELSGFLVQTRKKSEDQSLHDGSKSVLKREVVGFVDVEESGLRGRRFEDKIVSRCG